DSVNYFWDRHVLTYGLADQVRLAVDTIGRARDALGAVQLSVRKVLTIRAAELAGLLLLLAALLLLLARQRRPAFDLLRAHLARLGIDVGPATTMEEALQRARPEDAADRKSTRLNSSHV